MLKKLMLLKSISGGSSQNERTVIGNPVSFVANAARALTGFTIPFTPVQSGSGDPSPENVRPITGWTGITISHSGADTSDPTTYPVTFPALGKNLFNENDPGNQYGKFINSSYEVTDNTRGFISGVMKIKPNTYYAFSRGEVAPSSAYLVQYSEDGTALARANVSIGSNTSNAVKTNALADHAVFVLQCASGTTMSKSVLESYTIQMEEGSSSTSYEPFNNTQYGGEYNMLTGVLTVTDACIASYNGETLPGTWISDRDVYAAGTTPTTGAQAVYKLAEPQILQLAGAEIETLIGENVIWTNTNGLNEIKYMKS